MMTVDNSTYTYIDMKLFSQPFELIKSGKKTIKVRCNDQKSKQIKVGDIIKFTKWLSPREFIFAKVVDLKCFDTFEELYSSYPIAMFGYQGETVEDMIAKIDKIYSKEKQKDGALAIFIEV